MYLVQVIMYITQRLPGIALWFKSPSISYRKNSTPSTLPADSLVGDDLLVENDLLVGDDLLAPDFVGVPLLFRWWFFDRRMWWLITYRVSFKQ